MTDSETTEQKTIYVRDRRALDTWIHLLEIEHDSVFEADMTDIYQSVIDVAMEHDDEVVEQVEARVGWGDGR